MNELPKYMLIVGVLTVLSYVLMAIEAASGVGQELFYLTGLIALILNTVYAYKNIDVKHQGFLVYYVLFIFGLINFVFMWLYTVLSIIFERISYDFSIGPRGDMSGMFEVILIGYPLVLLIIGTIINVLLYPTKKLVNKIKGH